MASKFKREYEFDSEHATEPMTYDEKRQLAMDINMLSDDKMETVVNIIEAHGEDVGINPDRVEVDFEHLKTVTLRELEAYVKMVQRQDNKVPNPLRTLL